MSRGGKGEIIPEYQRVTGGRRVYKRTDRQRIYNNFTFCYADATLWDSESNSYKKAHGEDRPNF